MGEKHTEISESLLKKSQKQRERLDLLRTRLDLLTGKDKLLMVMYLENGNSFRQLARLTGASESSIGRKIYRLTKRLVDGPYIVCLRNRSKFTRTEMAVAKDYYLTGLSMKTIAARRNWSYYRARKTIKRIKRIVMA